MAHAVSNIKYGGDFSYIRDIDLILIGISAIGLTIGFSMIVHVLIEKPMAADLDGANQLLQAADTDVLCS